MNERDLKEEALEMFKEWDLDDMKEVCAEISKYGIELGAEFDALKHYIKAMLSRISETVFLYSLSHIALKKALVDSGIITREKLSHQILESPEALSLAKHLGIDFEIKDREEACSGSNGTKWLENAIFAKVPKPS